MNLKEITKDNNDHRAQIKQKKASINSKIEKIEEKKNQIEDLKKTLQDITVQDLDVNEKRKQLQEMLDVSLLKSGKLNVEVYMRKSRYFLSLICFLCGTL